MDNPLIAETADGSDILAHPETSTVTGTFTRTT